MKRKKTKWGCEAVKDETWAPICRSWTSNILISAADNIINRLFLFFRQTTFWSHLRGLYYSHVRNRLVLIKWYSPNITMALSNPANLPDWVVNIIEPLLDVRKQSKHTSQATAMDTLLWGLRRRTRMRMKGTRSRHWVTTKSKSLEEELSGK